MAYKFKHFTAGSGGGDNPIVVPDISKATYEEGKFYLDSTSGKNYKADKIELAATKFIKVTSPETSTASGNVDACWDGEKFVILNWVQRQESSIYKYRAKIIYGNSSSTWSLIDTGIDINYSYGKISFANGLYFLCDMGAIYKSSDLVTWTKMTGDVDTYNYTKVVYALSAYWVIGRMSHKVYKSTDGNTWTTAAEISPLGDFYDLIYTDKTWGFVAYGAGGRFYVSADGVKWSQSGEVPSSATITHACFDAVNQSDSAYPALILVSSNKVYKSLTSSGVTAWTSQPTLYSRHVACIDGKILLTGSSSSGGTIFRSYYVNSITDTSWKTFTSEVPSGNPPINTLVTSGRDFCAVGQYNNSGNSIALAAGDEFNGFKEYEWTGEYVKPTT